MPTSNSYDFTRNRDEIINTAFDLLGLKANGNNLSAQQVGDAAILLNMFIKTLPAGGISLWRYQEIVLFVDTSKESYLLGPSGDHASSSYVKSELSIAGVALDSTITVDSTAGMSDGDNIGIVLDAGTIQWTTINGAPTATVITLTDSLDSAAAIDNHVYTYTSKVQRPSRIISGRVKDANGHETVLTPSSRQEYFDLPVKSNPGFPTLYYYNPTLTNGTIYIWPVNNTDSNIILLTGQRQLQDLDNGTDNLDFPPEWELAITYSLADLLITSYSEAISIQKADRISKKAEQFMEFVEDYDRETTSIRFVPQ